MEELQPPVKIGITGTRYGMNEYQRGILKLFLIKESLYNKEVELHHGDCIGVDVEAAALAKELGIRTVCHPPIDGSHRAHHASDVTLKAHTYFLRNRNIVDLTNNLIVIPFQNAPQSRGGTWYTYDYARKNNKVNMIVYPDGMVVKNEY